MEKKIESLIAVIELTENKVGLETLKEVLTEINYQPSTNLLPTLSKEKIQKACNIHYKNYPCDGDELKYVKVAYMEGAKWALSLPTAYIELNKSK